ncbi:MAG: sigma-54 dependent transcriptional regulator [Spirochaetia bacterium]|nr:sigma-54 dependent transcriptional regulator [Spirochaetia bacterium]MCF7946361.1 sigma-54 dependent transcriptional regulator [Spirochaetia bacterium]
MTPSILIIDDDPKTHTFFQEYFKNISCKSFFDYASGLNSFQKNNFDLVILNTGIKEMSFNAAISSFTKPVNHPPLIIVIDKFPDDKELNLSGLGKVFINKKPLQLHVFQKTLQKCLSSFFITRNKNTIELNEKIRERFIGLSQEAIEVKNLIQSYAGLNEPVLITGETGTGKDVAAKLLHDLSRYEENFSPVNSTAIPSSLVESEIFGHEKGAFTGADLTHKGYLEIADSGTLFLDEIGDMPKFIQAKLLRVIENHTFTRLGGTKKIKVNTRLITATNKNLSQQMKRGIFRSDLYYRISVLHIHIPPLRKRKTDIPILANYFIKKNNSNIQLSSEASNRLTRYKWPGNIRELFIILKRIIINKEIENIEKPVISLEDIDSIMSEYRNMEWNV